MSSINIGSFNSRGCSGHWYSSRLRWNNVNVRYDLLSCVVRGSALVRSVVRFGLTVARYNYAIDSNALFCCNHYSWSLDDLLCGSIYRILLLPTPVMTWLMTIW